MRCSRYVATCQTRFRRWQVYDRGVIYHANLGVARLDELGARKWPGKTVCRGRASLPPRQTLAGAPCCAASGERWVRRCSQRPSRSAARGQVGPERPSAMPNPPDARTRTASRRAQFGIPAAQSFVLEYFGDTEGGGTSRPKTVNEMLHAARLSLAATPTPELPLNRVAHVDADPRAALLLEGKRVMRLLVSETKSGSSPSSGASSAMGGGRGGGGGALPLPF
eukprot:scaffold10228_cov111-Isochrysis_galbana.AAC.1